MKHLSEPAKARAVERKYYLNQLATRLKTYYMYARRGIKRFPPNKNIFGQKIQCKTLKKVLKAATIGAASKCTSQPAFLEFPPSLPFVVSCFCLPSFGGQTPPFISGLYKGSLLLQISSLCLI